MPSRSKKNKYTMITVEQLVDIALGTPEIGAVNFNVLHALLHVIVQQLNIQKCLVEFKGHDSERMEGIIMTAKPGPVLKVSEYFMDLTDGKSCIPAGKVPVPLPSDRAGGKIKNSLPKSGTGTFISDEGDKTSREGGISDFDSKMQEKKQRSEDSKIDSTREKYDRSKDESAEMDLDKSVSNGVTEKEKIDELKEDGNRIIDNEINEKPGKEEESEKKLSKKERCKEKKLAKKRVREGEGAEAAISDAREKSEVEPSEKKKGEEAEIEGNRKKKKACPCKAQKEEEQGPETNLKTTSSYHGSESECRSRRTEDGLRTAEGCQTIVRVETLGERCDSWRTRPALLPESLVKLEEKVALLQEAFETLEKMPTNEELISRTSSSGCLQTPVKNMWQLFNLNKRMESCEGAIEKLASMIEDVVKETCSFREEMMVIADAVDAMECNEETCAKRVSQCCGAQPGQPHKSSVKSSETTKEVIAFPVVETNPCNAFAQAASGNSKTVDSQSTEVQVQLGEQNKEVLNHQNNQNHQNHQNNQNNQNHETQLGPSVGDDFFKLSLGEKLCTLKECIECLMCQFKKFSDLIPFEQLAAKLCAIVTMQKQLESLRSEWEQFLQSFGDDRVPSAVSFIKSIKDEIEEVNEYNDKFCEERQQLETTVQMLQQEIEIVKSMKADKETMEDLLAEKADASVVNRKVSHDQFDAACDDLTKGLDVALERLIAQEAMWNEAMDELQKDMENKLDKLEIMPLKEFISKKLKSLQEKLQQLAQLRKDAEAAGAKSRILRNLNCIACDNDVIMRMESKGTSQHPSLPPSRSKRAYITYELDQVRKAIKKGTVCRGPTPVEEAVTEGQRKNIGHPIVRDATVNKQDHYCNRYCGGSHTITTPQQRVTRIGHFLTEFGPQAMAIFNQNNVNLPECKSVEEIQPSVVSRKDIQLY